MISSEQMKQLFLRGLFEQELVVSEAQVMSGILAGVELGGV